MPKSVVGKLCDFDMMLRLQYRNIIKVIYGY